MSLILAAADAPGCPRELLKRPTSPSVDRQIPQRRRAFGKFIRTDRGAFRTGHACSIPPEDALVRHSEEATAGHHAEPMHSQVPPDQPPLRLHARATATASAKRRRLAPESDACRRCPWLHGTATRGEFDVAECCELRRSGSRLECRSCHVWWFRWAIRRQPIPRLRTLSCPEAMPLSLS